MCVYVCMGVWVYVVRQEDMWRKLVGSLVIFVGIIC